MWIKIKDNPPPTDIDVLFQLEDKTCAVGFKREINDLVEYVPDNIVAEGKVSMGLRFEPKPIAWRYLPD